MTDNKEHENDFSAALGSDAPASPASTETHPISKPPRPSDTWTRWAWVDADGRVEVARVTTTREDAEEMSEEGDRLIRVHIVPVDQVGSHGTQPLSEASGSAQSEAPKSSFSNSYGDSFMTQDAQTREIERLKETVERRTKEYRELVERLDELTASIERADRAYRDKHNMWAAAITRAEKAEAELAALRRESAPPSLIDTSAAQERLRGLAEMVVANEYKAVLLTGEDVAAIQRVLKR